MLLLNSQGRSIFGNWVKLGFRNRALTVRREGEGARISLMKNSSTNAEATDHTTSHERELQMHRTLPSAEREGKVLPEDDVCASLKGLAAQARLHTQASAAEKQLKRAQCTRILRAEMLTELQLLLGCGNENLSSM